MKAFSTLLFVVLMSLAGHAANYDSSPFSPELAKQLKQIDPLQMNYDGTMTPKVARATYDIAVNGGATGAHGLGVYIPKNALLKQSWFYTVTQFADSGSGTVALSCEDTNNIYSAADVTGIAAGAKTSGVQTGTAANMTGNIAADCEITATVAGVPQTSGKLILFVEYLLVE